MIYNFEDFARTVKAKMRKGKSFDDAYEMACLSRGSDPNNPIDKQIVHGLVDQMN